MDTIFLSTGAERFGVSQFHGVQSFQGLHYVRGFCGAWASAPTYCFDAEKGEMEICVFQSAKFKNTRFCAQHNGMFEHFPT